MKILLIGTFSPARVELSYESSFKSLNCDVSRLDGGSTNRLLGPLLEFRLNNKLTDVIQKERPDLILVMKGYYLWPKTIKKISERKESLLFCFNGDDPFNIACRGSSNNNILNSIRFYDCYFIWAKALVEKLRSFGAKRVEPLPFGFDASIHHPLNIPEQEKKTLNSDIVFVGNWDEERERCLREISDLGLSIWGESYWKNRCRSRALRMRYKGKPAYAQEMSRVLSSSRISLNILRKQNKGNHNMRTFEAPACSVFVLSERSEEAKHFFEEDKEAVYFSSPKELREKIRYYLAHDEERNGIALAGYNRCLKSGYSYLERAKRILEVYRELKNCK